MKLKIFNVKPLVVWLFLIAALPALAQKSVSKDSTDYRQQMRQLRNQMRQLQQQMNRLEVQELRKQAQTLRNQGQALRSTGKYYEWGDLDPVTINGQKLSDSIVTRLKLNSVHLNDSIVGNLTNTINQQVWAQVAPLHQLSTTIRPLTPMRGIESEADLKKLVQSGDIKEKVKTYSKTYPVNSNDTIQIKNSYGRVSVNTWNKSEVKVDIEMKAYANEEADAQKLLDNISITEGKDNNQISFKTNIASTRINNSNTNVLGTWFNSGKRYTRKMVINYIVYMPAKSHLNVSNTFGSIILPELLGKVSINLNNGSLISQPLVNPENRYNISFSDGNIAAVNGGKLNVSYSRLNVGTADKLKATSSFSALEVDKLKSWGDVAIRYGEGLKVNELDKNVKNLNINASFTKLAINPGNDVNFDVTTHLGDFNYDTTDVKLVNEMPAADEHRVRTTKIYKGKIGKGDANKTISIKSSFTNVKFD